MYSTPRRNRHMPELLPRESRIAVGYHAHDGCGAPSAERFLADAAGTALAFASRAASFFILTRTS